MGNVEVKMGAMGKYMSLRYCLGETRPIYD